MTTAKQAILYELAEALVNRPKGISLVFKSHEQAVNMRFALYKLRDRLKATLPQAHPIRLMLFSIKDNKLVVTIGSGLTDYTIIDEHTGENITGKFEFVDEVVELTDEDFKEVT